MSKTGRCSGHVVALGRLTGSMLALDLPESHLDDNLGGLVRVYGQFGSLYSFRNLVICKNRVRIALPTPDGSSRR